MRRTLILLLAVALAACAPVDQGEIIPTRTPLPPPSATPIPDTPTPTGTPVPTMTPTPAPPPTATPEAGLSYRGPWLVFAAQGRAGGASQQSIFAVNADGTGLTRLVDGRASGLSPSPASARLAYVGDEAAAPGGLALKLVQLPGGQVQTAAGLLPPGFPPASSLATGDDAWQVLQAVQSQEPRWSADADHIVYVGAADGPTADVYLFNLFTWTAVRLSDEAGQAVNPRWSPDERVVAYGVKRDLQSGPAERVDEVRLAWANGSGDRPLYTPSGAGERLYGWPEYNVALVSSYRPECGYVDLRAVNVDSTAERVLWSGPYGQAAFDPASGAILVAAAEPPAGCEVAPPATAGLYLFTGADDPPAPVGGDSAAPVQSIRWSAGEGAFIVTAGEFGGRPQSVLRLTPQGEVSPSAEAPHLQAAASPAGDRVAWYSSGASGEPGLWLAAPGDLPQPIFSDAVQYVTWSPDGQSLFFFRPPGAAGPAAYVARRPTFRPAPLLDGVTVSAPAVWVRRPR